MIPKSRRLVQVACILAVVGSLGLNLFTGSRMFTRFEDPEIRAANEQQDLSALFADKGLDGSAATRRVETGFAFGWLPAGPGAASLSVATIAGPALGLLALLLFLERRRPRAAAT